MLLRLPIYMEQAEAGSMAEQSRQDIIGAVREYGKRLFYFIRGRVDTDADAEDILQDVWLQFTRILNAEPVEQVGAWLYRVARNRIVDKYRKKDREIPTASLAEDIDEGVSLALPWLADVVDPAQEELRQIFWKQLFQALEELPPEQRNVFVWHELEDLSFNEISEKTGEKISTLLSRKRYAVIHLRRRLEPLYHQFKKT